MRALRDMNLPKFIFEDVPLFLGLISDLFPGLDCPRVRYPDFNDAVEQVLVDGGYTLLPVQVRGAGLGSSCFNPSSSPAPTSSSYGLDPSRGRVELNLTTLSSGVRLLSLSMVLFEAHSCQSLATGAFLFLG